MKDYGSIIENEQYYSAMIVTDDDSKICMSKSEQKKYFDLIEKCPIICDHLIVQMKLIKQNHLVEFNGLVAFNKREGRFSTYGTIDLSNKTITIYISLKNDDHYDRHFVSFDEINKGRVR